MADEKIIDKLIQDVAKNANEIDVLKRDCAKLEREYTKLETLFQGLKDLPEAIHKLDKTLTSFEGKLDIMNITICNLSKENKEQNKSLSEVKNQGNINWIDLISKNFWKLIGTICIGGYVLHDIIIKFKG